MARRSGCCLRRFDRDFVRAHVPARRVQQDAVDARLVHVLQQLVLGVVRDLAVDVDRRAAGPDVYLCVCDEHGCNLPLMSWMTSILAAQR